MRPNWKGLLVAGIVALLLISIVSIVTDAPLWVIWILGFLFGAIWQIVLDETGYEMWK